MNIYDVLTSMPQHCYNTIFDLHKASIAAWWLLTSPLIAPYAPLDTFHSIFHSYQSQSIAVPRLVEHGLRHCVQGGLKKPCLSQHRIPDFSHKESSWNTWNILKHLETYEMFEKLERRSYNYDM